MLGAEPTRCGDKKREPKYSYYIACPDCETRWGKFRLCKSVKNPSIYQCKSCETNIVSFKAGESMPKEPGKSTITIS